MYYHYQNIHFLLQLIDEPNRTACLNLYEDNRKLFQATPGSTNNHQAWPGGYQDHVQEVLNIARVQHGILNNIRTLPFSLSDLLLVVFLHDIEKPWKYILGDDGQLHHRPGMESKQDHQLFRMKKLGEYGVILTPEHENGLQYAEGEIYDYSPRERKMSPLAAVAHMCDVCSARVWYDHPLNACDSWDGAYRIRDLVSSSSRGSLCGNN